MWGERWRDRGYVAALEDRYRVIVPDLVGYGDGDKPHDPRAYGVTNWASDVIAVLDADGVDRVHVWGYSLGALVAQRVSVLVPDRVLSLTLGGMPPGLDLDQLRDRLGPEQVPATWEEMLEGWPEAVIEQYKAHNDLGAIQAIIPTIYESVTTVADMQAEPRPTLAYIGADEEYVELARRQSEALPCRFEVVPGNHFAAFAQSEKVVPLVIKHIEASDPAAD
jgi:pimeloyl-ACP methyl ester carboxylesterase